MAEPWTIAGEFVVSCNCDVFCPCVLSLGKARPSQGDCHSWFGFHIEEGQAGALPLGDLNVGLLLEVPGPMEQGNWTLGLYLDERASDAASAALGDIFTGRAGGPIGWWSIMIAEILGTRRVPITFGREGRGWRFTIGKLVDGLVEPVAGAGGDGLVRVTNTRYWMAPDVVVSTGTKSRARDWGRNWDLSGKSAEAARFRWSGP
ncbi:MAG TPA: DUF1326 domain-containing protein [Methylomirabilota bacterium]|jgi:hypothetical protein|nr:DUF1326 domain-containing protein [Methylomirabilota bacterium]